MLDRLMAVYWSIGNLFMTTTWHLLIILMLSLFSSRCVSEDVFKEVNSETLALIPAKTMAIPIFLVAENGSTFSSSKELLQKENIVEKIEEKVMKAFSQQPNVDGVSYVAVRKILGNENVKIWQNMALFLNKRSTILESIKSQTLSTDSCAYKKNFVSYYKDCLSNFDEWKTGLQSLSQKLYLADAALLTFLHDVKKDPLKNGSVTASLTLCLVDSNNAGIIWCNYDSKKIDVLLSEPFWKGYPGRIDLPSSGKK